jgi:hypothetical protein
MDVLIKSSYASAHDIFKSNHGLSIPELEEKLSVLTDQRSDLFLLQVHITYVYIFIIFIIRILE